MKDNLAIQALRKDNMEMLKVAITRGDCTPYDVDEYGCTLLTVSIFSGISKFQSLANDAFGEDGR